MPQDGQQEFDGAQSVSLSHNFVWTKNDHNKQLQALKFSGRTDDERIRGLNHFLLDPMLADVRAPHGVSKEDFKGPEFGRCDSHMFFGDDGVGGFQVAVFCCCDKFQGAKSILSCYRGRVPENEKRTGYCSMCTACVTRDQAYWYCPNCYEHICTGCHAAMEDKIKRRKEMMWGRVDATANPRHWVFEGNHWAKMSELIADPDHPYSKRSRDVTWEAQIALHGDGHSSPGAQYAFEDPRFNLG